MKQRTVAVVAEYLSKRPRGRLVLLRPVIEDDYLLAIQDRRDGRIQLIHSVGDLGIWIQSFRDGQCVQPAAAICGRCGRVHVDRDVDGELLPNCIRCQVELLEVARELAAGNEADL